MAAIGPTIGMVAILNTGQFTTGQQAYVNALNNMTKATATATQQMTQAMNKVTGGAGGGGMGGGAGGIGGMISSIDQLMRSLSGLNLGSLTGAVFIGNQLSQTWNNAVSAIKSYANEAMQAVAWEERLTISYQAMMSNELRNRDATLSMTEAMEKSKPAAEETLAWTRKIAIESPFTSQDVANTFQMALGFGFTSEKAKELTAGMLDWSAATGKTGQYMQRLMLNLGQVQSLGKLSGREIRDFAMAGLNVNAALQKETGKTQAQLNAMQRSGTLSAEVAIKAITRALKDYEGMGKAQATTFSGLISSMTDIKQVVEIEFFKPIFEAFRPLLTDVVNSLTDPKILAGIRQVGQSIGTVFGSAVEFVRKQVSELGPEFDRIFKMLNSGQIDFGGVVERVEGIITKLVESKEVQGAVGKISEGLGSAVGKAVTEAMGIAAKDQQGLITAFFDLGKNAGLSFGAGLISAISGIEVTGEQLDKLRKSMGNLPATPIGQANMARQSLFGMIAAASGGGDITAIANAGLQPAVPGVVKPGAVGYFQSRATPLEQIAAGTTIIPKVTEGGLESRIYNFLDSLAAGRIYQGLNEAGRPLEAPQMTGSAGFGETPTFFGGRMAVGQSQLQATLGGTLGAMSAMSQLGSALQKKVEGLEIPLTIGQSNILQNPAMAMQQIPQLMRENPTANQAIMDVIDEFIRKFPELGNVVLPTIGTLNSFITQMKSTAEAAVAAAKKQEEARTTFEQQLGKLLDKQKKDAAKFELQTAKQDENFQLSRAKSIESFNRQLAKSDEEFKVQQADTLENFAYQEQKTEESYYESRKEAAKSFGKEIEKAEEAHQRKLYLMSREHNRTLQEAVANRDAVAYVQEMRTYEAKRADEEEQYQYDTKQRNKEYAVQLADLESSFQKQRAQRLRDFEHQRAETEAHYRRAQALQKKNFAEQLQESEKNYQEQKRLRAQQFQEQQELEMQEWKQAQAVALAGEQAVTAATKTMFDTIWAQVQDMTDKIKGGPESTTLTEAGSPLSPTPMYMAGGGSFIVPAGYPNDTYPMRVSSGEGVTVTPASMMHSGGFSVDVNVNGPVSAYFEDQIIQQVTMVVRQALAQG